MTLFRYYSLSEAHRAEGVVVIIDVLRAFSTAAFALANGASKIYPVVSVDDAISLKSVMPQALIMGEVDGYKPDTFDLSNSPSEISKLKFYGCSLIQRTSAGTQGVFRSIRADQKFAASFVIANATAKKLRSICPPLISFVVTGESLGRDGDEDLSCGEYIEALVQGKEPDPDKFLCRIDTSTVGASFLKGKSNYLLKQDVDLCKKVDFFDFFLPINDDQEGLVITKGVVK